VLGHLGLVNLRLVHLGLDHLGLVNRRLVHLGLDHLGLDIVISLALLRDALRMHAMRKPIRLLEILRLSLRKLVLGWTGIRIVMHHLVVVLASRSHDLLFTEVSHSHLVRRLLELYVRLVLPVDELLVHVLSRLSPLQLILGLGIRKRVQVKSWNNPVVVLGIRCINLLINGACLLKGTLRLTLYDLKFFLGPQLIFLGPFSL